LAVYFAATGKESELEQTLLELVEASRAEPGCLRYDLLCSRDGYGEFVFVEEWASDEALELHRQTSHLREAQAKVQGSIGSLPRVNVYRQVA
jgi:quinol monooxygenase YgiN